MLLGLMVYVRDEVISSRAIERATYDSVAARLLMVSAIRFRIST